MKNERAKSILKILKETYTHRPEEFIQWSNPLELVIGIVLSAQSTDRQVNAVCKKLFKKYKTPTDYADANIEELQKDIYSTGFYKSKAKYLKEIGRIIRDEFNNQVPNNLQDLLILPGVSYKTAHLVMAKAWGIKTGVAVDTHVARLAPRLGLSKQTNPLKIGADLERIFPKADWLNVNEYLILHGRALCGRKPKCLECPLQDICPSAGSFISKYWS